MYDSVYINLYKIGKSIETENRFVAARGSGERRIEGDHLTSTGGGVILGMMKRFWH